MIAQIISILLILYHPLSFTEIKDTAPEEITESNNPSINETTQGLPEEQLVIPDSIRKDYMKKSPDQDNALFENSEQAKAAILDLVEAAVTRRAFHIIEQNGFSPAQIKSALDWSEKYPFMQESASKDLISFIEKKEKSLLSSKKRTNRDSAMQDLHHTFRNIYIFYLWKMIVSPSCDLNWEKDIISKGEIGLIDYWQENINRFHKAIISLNDNTRKYEEAFKKYLKNKGTQKESMIELETNWYRNKVAILYSIVSEHIYDKFDLMDTLDSKGIYNLPLAKNHTREMQAFHQSILTPPFKKLTEG